MEDVLQSASLIYANTSRLEGHFVSCTNITADISEVKKQFLSLVSWSREKEGLVWTAESHVS